MKTGRGGTESGLGIIPPVDLLAGFDPRRFRRRWVAMNAVTRREAKALSPEERLVQLGTLHLFLRSTAGAGESVRRKGDKRVRNRWNRLRRVLRGSA